jgi:trans-2,3-dihydro-3-hydroxyanthranilate isomerase
MATRSYAFHHVDVFTDTALEGNPLAVFPNAAGLDDATMQRVARELNLSETSFVFPTASGEAAAALRIFTPFIEVPFAGHPTIGTAFVLRSTGAIPAEQRSFVLEERVGPVAVRVEPGDAFMAWLTTPRTSFGKRFDDREGVATALGLDTADLRDGVPIEAVSAGNPFVYVALNDEATVDRAGIDARGMRVFSGGEPNTGVYVFATRANGVYSRMFAPEAGVFEDPATGSATGPLAAFLLQYGLFPERDGLRLVCEQGRFMGRRSILHVLITGRGPDRKIEVGGSAVHVIEATLSLSA